MAGQGVTRRGLTKLTVAGLLSRHAQAADILKIGVIADLSGSSAAWGQAIKIAGQIAADDVNVAGGLKVGDRSYQVGIVAYDDQYQAAKAVSAVSRLVDEDGVKFLLGPLSSASAIAVKPIVQARGVLTFAGSYSKKIIEPGTKFLFRAYSTPVEYFGPMLDWLKRDGPQGIDKVVLLNPNDETGWDGQDTQLKGYAAGNVQVVARELYERATKDFQPILTRVLATGPQLIELGTSAPATAGLIVRQAREMGYKGTFIKIGGPGPHEIIAAAGRSASEGVINYLQADESDPTYQQIAAKAKKYSPHPMHTSTINFIDAARIMMAAMQKAGTVTDSEAVRAAIPEVMPMPSVLGAALRLGGRDVYGADNQVITPSYIGIIHDGQIQTAGVVE